MNFYDRREAGEKLGEVLAKTYNNKNTIIYALPRGGVITGVEVAKALHAPLDLIITRKIGHPSNSEYALAVVSQNGQVVGNQEEIASVDQSWFAEQVEKEKKEIERRKNVYLRKRKIIDPKGKIAIIVDDGIATGLTMKVAIEDIRSRNPEKIIVAVPVIPNEDMGMFKQLADDVIALYNPEAFLGAVGSYYTEFPQVTDEEVMQLLSDTPSDPIIFSFPEYAAMEKELLPQLDNFHEGNFIIKRFPNKELHVEITSSVAGNNCVILGSIAPPDEQLLSATLLSHTLKKEQAKDIVGIFPYLAYSRHDKDEPGRSLGAAWVGKILQISEMTSILTFDIHSKKTAKLFPIPITSLSPASIFAETIKELELSDATIVAPDEGAQFRAQEVANKVNSNQEITYCTKTRTADGFLIDTLHGKVTKEAIIIDDILDTGKTLIECCKKLREAGTETITIFITHGLFTGAAWKELWNVGVKAIYVTNTVAVPKNLQEESQNIHVLSVTPLLAKALRRYFFSSADEMDTIKEEAYV